MRRNGVSGPILVSLERPRLPYLGIIRQFLERLSGNSQCGSDVASFGGAKRPKWCSLAPFRTLAGPCNGAYSEFPDSLSSSTLSIQAA
jgi:hypothetical protein